ncbi:MAG TPA: DUF2480 family protein [Puia sp.]|nr:DUF2480 family protein [Puia sp.]
MSEGIVNKVALSGLLTLDLEDYYPREEIVLFDLKPYLFIINVRKTGVSENVTRFPERSNDGPSDKEPEALSGILREKDFRAALQEMDWTRFQDKIVAVTCSVDAIIPLWAYMLVAVNLQPFARDIVMGDEKAALQQIFLARIAAIDIQEFADKRVIVKGCGDLSVGGYAYLDIAKRLRPVVKSIMYGEACSNVPVFKKMSGKRPPGEM